jgi:hypothetical protein
MDAVLGVRALIQKGELDLNTVIGMITDGKSQLHNVKKLRIIIGLIRSVYGNDILEIIQYEDGCIQLTFKNKPNQPLRLVFHMFDEWDKIKMKMDKLRDSNGECVVCCETEKIKAKNELTLFCSHCCEFTCLKCLSQFGEEKNDNCPICRQPLSTYFALYALID